MRLIKEKIKGAIGLFKPIIKNTTNWPRLILNRAKILKDDVLTYKFKNGLRFSIENAKGEFESSGMATITEIFITKNYNPPGMEIEEKDVIIDIGANIGIFSIYASKKAPKGKIYAFEPFKTHFLKLNKNLKLNKIKNIKTFSLAVDKDNKPKSFFISKTHTGNHSLLKNENTTLETKTECISLKEVFKQNKIKKCDFIKIDCEGGEYDILYGAPKDILNKIKKISLEFDNIDQDKKNGSYLKNYLENNGFKVKINGEFEKSGILYAKK